MTVTFGILYRTAQKMTGISRTRLQEYLQKSYIPVYETERMDAGFVCTVAVKVSPDEMQRYRGRPHPNKKAAEQESAKVACYHLKLVTQPM